MSQFKGLKVLELASVLAGPAVGQFFAELGAEVIKVENLKSLGDVTRTWKLKGEITDDRSAYFCSVNWGKRSIALDLTSAEGQKIVEKLARDADVVIASYKPGDAEKLKVDYTALSAKNPEIIYGQITGYGSSNPRVGYDAIIQAEAGFIFMNGEADGPSLKMPVALMDVLAGHQLKEAILLAMLEKMKSGKGKMVEVSLIQSAIASLVNQATNWLVANKLPSKQGSAHPNIAPYGDVFITGSEDEVILAVGSDGQFKALLQVLGLKEIESDPRFLTNSLRVENRLQLNDFLNKAILKLSTEELMQKLNAQKIPGGIINRMDRVFEMEEAKALLLEGDGVFGVKSFVGQPSYEKSSHILPPPHFGQHTDEILSEMLQFSPKEIENLKAGKIIL